MKVLYSICPHFNIKLYHKKEVKLAIKLISTDKQLEPYDQSKKTSLLEYAWLIVSYGFVVTLAVMVLTELFK